MTLNISYQSLPVCSFFWEISWQFYGNSPIGNSLAAFKILSLSLTFGIWIVMCLGVGLFASILLGTLCFLDLHVYFLHQIREIIFHYFFKYISNFLLFLFSFWHPYDANVGIFEVVSMASYTILGFFGFFFSCCSDWLFFASLFQIIDLIIPFMHSTVVSLWIVLYFN